MLIINDEWAIYFSQEGNSCSCSGDPELTQESFENLNAKYQEYVE